MAKVYSGGVTIATGFKLNDPQPIVDYMVVGLIADLVALPNQFNGMLVFVEENDKYYSRKDGVWGIEGGVEIVNNLTAGGTTKALSAEQGKVLQGSKMNRLQNGTGSAINIQSLETLVSLGFDLSYANLYSMDLSYSSLDSANLSYANLDSANLDGANLTYSSLDSANLSYANLDSASLDGANLDGTNLTYANLYGANLSYANLDSANLYGANLSYAIGLDTDINVALANVNKDSIGDGSSWWNLTWTDGNAYSCDPASGTFVALP